MDYYRLKKYYIKIKNALLAKKNKEFLVFLLFFVIASAFWLLQSLNETFDVDLQVPLRLVGVPQNVVITTNLPSHMRLTVRDKGTVLTRYLYGAELAEVEVDYRDYETGQGSGRVAVPSADVQKRVQSQLWSSSRVVALRPDTLEFFFNRGARKRVPVRWAGTVTTPPEYYLRAVEFDPDSVDVLAPAGILDTITTATIRPTHLTDVSANQVIPTPLQVVRGAKFVPAKVDTKILVDLYTDKTVEVPIVGVNFPANKDLRTFPSRVKVTFKLGMSRFKEVTAEHFVLPVTYEELIQNNSSKIHLQLRSLPEGVMNVRIEPSEVDYLVEQVPEEDEE